MFWFWGGWWVLGVREGGWVESMFLSPVYSSGFEEIS